jgi:hypothetical protein
LGFKSIQNKVFKIYLGQLVRYGTEIIKGVGIPQSGQVILLTNKNLFYDEHNLSYYLREAIVAFLTVIL